MKRNRIAVWGLVVSFVFALVGCSDSSPTIASGGPIDGAWRLDNKVCNGVEVDMTGWPVTTFTITNTSGSIANELCMIPVTLTYPVAGTVNWVIGQNQCGGTGDQHAATYTVDGSTLTLTEALTPAGEYLCGSGRQIGTFTRLK